MSTLRLHYDGFGRLVLTTPEGETIVGVTPARCFPFSAPNECVAFCDAHGHEVYYLPALDALPEQERAMLTRDLTAREFTPVIERIHAVSSGAEPTTWDVTTDRGRVTFELPSEDNIRRLDTHGALIADTHGVRYRVLDMRKLDALSRKLLARYL